MIRYVSRPRRVRLGDEDDGDLRMTGTAMTIVELEPQSRATGLLDAFGQPIYAEENTGPIGFIPRET